MVKVSRFIAHTSFIISKTYLASLLAAVLVAASALLSPISPLFSSILVAVSTLLIPLLASFIASRVALELSELRVQVYLAAGLTRLEYILAWVVAFPAYMSLTLFAATISPVVLSVDVFSALLPLPNSPTLFALALALAFTGLLHSSLALFFAVAFRRRGLEVAAVMVYAILVPMIAAIVFAPTRSDLYIQVLLLSNPVIALFTDPFIVLRPISILTLVLLASTYIIASMLIMKHSEV